MDGQSGLNRNSYKFKAIPPFCRRWTNICGRLLPIYRCSNFAKFYRNVWLPGLTSRVRLQAIPSTTSAKIAMLTLNCWTASSSTSGLQAGPA
jgi:hypothetical protein